MIQEENQAPEEHELVQAARQNYTRGLKSVSEVVGNTAGFAAKQYSSVKQEATSQLDTAKRSVKSMF